MWPAALAVIVVCALALIAFAMRKADRVKARLKAPFFSFAIETGDEGRRPRLADPAHRRNLRE